MHNVLLSTSSTIAPITDAGTDLLTWVVSSMQSLWQFIVANPLLVALCAMLLISFGAGLFFRFVRSL